jgi:murein DD-endopeptidase MepM/ murein hydrolase activator NlpD
VLAVVLAVLTSHPALAGNQAAPARVASRISAVRESLTKLARALNDAEKALDQAQVASARHQKALQSASARQQVLRSALSGRASAMYTMGSGSILESVLGAESMIEVVNKLSYLELIRSREQGLLEELTALRRRARIETAELSRIVRDAAAVRRSYAERQSELVAKLRELQSLQNLLVALGGGRGRLYRAPSGFVCPVAGPHVVLNNYGDPRPGGPHTGDDIRADSGTPTVAVLPSKVVATPSGGWIGIGLVIRDAMGNEWLYAHMSRVYVSTGEHLRAGQLVGRVGCTGRCYGPHLHFEYHPHGGSPANPYRILSSAC